MISFILAPIREMGRGCLFGVGCLFGLLLALLLLGLVFGVITSDWPVG